MKRPPPRMMGAGPDTVLTSVIGNSTSGLAAHVAAGNPHPNYLTQAEGDALYQPIGGGGVDTANSPNAGEFARFTDADTIEGRTVSETKSDLSLGNVNNTSDANKPVSTAQQAALDLKANLSLFSAFAQTFLDDANEAAFKATVNLEPGVDMAALSHSHAQSDVTNLVTDLAGKQATLVSGTNIKTVNGTTLLGSGDLVAGGGDVSAANSPNANEVARFTGANTIEGRTAAEFKADLDLEVGVDFPALNHAHEIVTAGANTAVNNAADQQIASRTVTGLVAGDQVVVEAFFTILNNSGATRVYTITLDFDARFDIEISTGALATSATLMHPFHLRAVLDIRSTSLAYEVVRMDGQLAAGIASGGDVTQAATMLGNLGWGESTQDLTGSTNVTLHCRSANNTATQTFRLHSLCVRKLTPN